MKSLLTSLLLLATLPLFAEEALTLEDAWRIALRDNPNEAVTRARFEQALTRVTQARSAYHPQLEATGRGARVSFSDTQQALNPLLDDSAEQFEAALRATFLLWDGGSRRSRLDAALSAAEAAEASLEEIRMDLLANVGRAFTSAQLARENVRISTADAEFQNRQLQDIRRREAAGAASRADRLNFDIRRLAAENAAVTAKANYDNAMAALAALLGVDADHPLPPPAPVDPDAEAAEAPAYSDAWAEAQTLLPALARAEAQLEAARANVGVERGTRRPTLAAFGDVSATRADDPAFTGDDVGNTIGLQVSWDLWDGGRRRAATREAELGVDEAAAGARGIELQAQSRLASAIHDYNAAIQSEQITKETLELTRENRDLVEAAFRAGQESLLRLNEAQRDFTTAESRAIQARLTREQTWIDLQRAKGTLVLP
jgi:outer membrane protein